MQASFDLSCVLRMIEPAYNVHCSNVTLAFSTQQVVLAKNRPVHANLHSVLQLYLELVSELFET
jgi:hypothetical protein